MRLFVAIRFSPQVNTALLQAQNALHRQGAGSFTRPENFHLTLAFIGETERINAAISAMKHICADPFSLKLSHIGNFGDIYWAGTAETPALSALQQQVYRLLKCEGFSLEKRAFRPHLTLCRRFRPHGELDLETVNAALDCASGCRIARVSLMESKQIQGKLVYTERYGKNLL